MLHQKGVGNVGSTMVIETRPRAKAQSTEALLGVIGGTGLGMRQSTRGAGLRSFASLIAGVGTDQHRLLLLDVFPALNGNTFEEIAEEVPTGFLRSFATLL